MMTLKVSLKPLLLTLVELCSGDLVLGMVVAYVRISKVLASTVEVPGVLFQRLVVCSQMTPLLLPLFLDGFVSSETTPEQ